MTPRGFALVSNCPAAPITADGAMALMKSLRRFETWWQNDWPTTDLQGNWTIQWSADIGATIEDPSLVLTRVVQVLDVPDDIAYHYQDTRGRACCDIGLAAVLSQSSSLTGPDGLWSAINHEHLECRLDPTCLMTVKKWLGVLNPDGQDEPLEACDRLQGSDYCEPGSEGIFLANAGVPDFFRPGKTGLLDIRSDLGPTYAPISFTQLPEGYHESIDPKTGVSTINMGARMSDMRRARVLRNGPRGGARWAAQKQS